jgi:hypothetical protein
VILFSLLLAAALQAAPAAPQPGAVEQLLLPGATAAPDCGGLNGMAGRAVCVSAPMADMDRLAQAYVAALGQRGWIAADGADNRVVFVRRRAEGGCDGLQMQAFYDTTRPAAPDAIAYLGFGAIPGNLCADQPATATPAPAPQ